MNWMIVKIYTDAELTASVMPTEFFRFMVLMERHYQAIGGGAANFANSRAAAKAGAGVELPDRGTCEWAAIEYYM
jgi:hypothetical protein